MSQRCSVALVIIDMLNPFDFPEAKQLYPHAFKAAQAIVRLKRKIKSQNLPVLYVNDNFKRWRSDWKAIYQFCLSPQSLGRDIARLLCPEDDDYFVLKPRNSGFHETALETLLKELGVKKIILTGVAGNICVLFTAQDAMARGFQAIVPSDCVASNTLQENHFSLQQIHHVLKMSIKKSTSLTKKDFMTRKL
jgi:nicotinamidase-related amidase